MRRKAIMQAATKLWGLPPPIVVTHCSQTWAMLVKRVYEVDPLTCPKCGGQMKVIAFIEPRAPERSDGRGAVVLCLFGGAIGILLGRWASILVRSIMHWPTQPSLFAIAAAFAVSATVGVIFGFYPAWKASRLDPVEALRYE
jgi:hypothetical protein